MLRDRRDEMHAIAAGTSTKDARRLRGRLAGSTQLRRATVLARVVAAHGQVPQARGEEGKGITLALVGVEVVRGAGRRRAVVSGLESDLSGAAVKGTSRVCAAGGAKVRVQRAWIGSGGSTKT